MSDEKIAVNCVIAIDPGSNGGIVVYEPGRPVKAVKMPKDATDFRDLMQYYAENYTVIAFLEKLSVRPDDVTVEAGGGKNMGKVFRIQKLLANYEHLRAVLEVVGIPFVMVHPMTWQSGLQLRRKGEDKADRKRRFARIAAELYTEVKVTLWNADALLILTYGRWALRNRLDWVRANLPGKVSDKLF